MDIESNFIKPVLLFHFSKGKSEIEAHSEISQQYGKYAISLKTVKKWFGIFSKEYNYSAIKGSTSSLEKLPDELLTNFINGKSDFKLKELEGSTNCSRLTLSTRRKHINSGRENSTFNKKRSKKGIKKLSDEFIIDLVNNNSTLNIKELSKLAQISSKALSIRIKQINSEGEIIRYCKRRPKGSITKLPDEFLINLINQNPNSNMEELAKLAQTSRRTISRRLKEINSDADRINYSNKKAKKEGFKPATKQKLTNETLISLINENPHLNNKELAKLANTSLSTISRRLKQINNEVQSTQSLIHKDSRNLKKSIDELLINLINENPDLGMEELDKLVNESRLAISDRLKKINNGEEELYNIEEDRQIGITKSIDKFLINLINQSLDFDLEELSILSNVSLLKICQKLKLIYIEGERAHEVIKNDQDSIKKFIDDILTILINENTGLSIEKLLKLSNAPRSEILSRLRQVKGKEERLNNCKKGSQNGSQKFTDDYLIDLINQNPHLNMEELAKLSNTSRSTISLRLKQINTNGHKILNYRKKYTSKSATKFTDEYLINLINNNPSLNMKELAELANTSTKTIANRLKQINSGKIVVKYTCKKNQKGLKNQKC